MFDVESIRKDFVPLREGRIYLDSTATSLTPEPVINKMAEYYHDYRANVGRGIYSSTKRATEEFEKARAEVARMVNCKPSELVFVKSSTEGLNLVARGIGLGKGDRVVTTIVEHHSNYVIWLRARDKAGAELKVVRSDRDGIFDLSDFEEAINDRTKIVSVTHVSNVLGVRLPIKEIGEIAHAHGALFAVDGAQSVPHMPVDIKKLGCDFLAFSGHKMCGPTGIGALYVREDLQEAVEPLSVGGGAIEDVGIDSYRLRKGPSKYEAGTPPIAEAIGMGAAASYLMRIGMDNILSHEERLTELMLQGLAEVPGLMLYGPQDPRLRTGIFSFNVSSIHPHDVAMALDVTAGIMVRSGHHCALPLLRDLLNIADGTVRASVYLYNNKGDVHAFLEALGEIARSM